MNVDPKLQAEIDQAMTGLAENYPTLWRSLHKNLLKEGFNNTQAFKLLQTYILSQSPYGVRGDDG